jgi:periplasmic divalent cation tolerance protein
MEGVATDAGSTPPLTLVLTTVPGEAIGERLVHQLVEERLIACANLIPGLTSVFRWEGEIRRETEFLILMKTHPDHMAELYERVQELHPYEVPELIELPVGRSLPAYCRWVAAETGEGS